MSIPSASHGSFDVLSFSSEIFSEEKCPILTNPNGIFAKCHEHIPTDSYFKVRRISKTYNYITLPSFITTPLCFSKCSPWDMSVRFRTSSLVRTLAKLLALYKLFHAYILFHQSLSCVHFEFRLWDYDGLSTVCLQDCILRTCNCKSSLRQCMCVSLANYAKACAYLGVAVGDWRTAANCSEYNRQ